MVRSVCNYVSPPISQASMTCVLCLTVKMCGCSLGVWVGSLTTRVSTCTWRRRVGRWLHIPTRCVLVAAVLLAVMATGLVMVRQGVAAVIRRFRIVCWVPVLHMGRRVLLVGRGEMARRLVGWRLGDGGWNVRIHVTSSIIIIIIIIQEFVGTVLL